MTPRVIPASPSETVAWLELAESMWAHSEAEAKRLGLDPRGLAGGLMGMAIGQLAADRYSRAEVGDLALNLFDEIAARNAEVGGGN